MPPRAVEAKKPPPRPPPRRPAEAKGAPAAAHAAATKPKPRAKSPSKKSAQAAPAKPKAKPAGSTSGAQEAPPASASTEATALACEPASETSAPGSSSKEEGSVHVKYNHYNQSFPLTHGGKLDWQTIDEQYCISFVYKGAFGKSLVRTSDGHVFLHDASETFMGLVGGDQYDLVVKEDEAAEEEARKGAERKVYRGRDDGVGVTGASNGSKLVTQELKGLSIEELRAGGDRYKALLEARDLEDVLYGNG